MRNIIVIGLIIIGTQAHAQGVTKQDVVKAWDIITKMVVQSAQLMPDEHYAYSPGEPLRNFADQLNHTTASNIMFAPRIGAGPPNFPIPDRNNPPQTKEKVMPILEQSFSYFKGALNNLADKDLSEKILWGRNQVEITRLKAILIIMSHLQREHGKTMMYLRAKGITPPPAGSWSFD